MKVQCAYCDLVHISKSLPYSCPGCGHVFKVITAAKSRREVVDLVRLLAKEESNEQL